MSTKPILLTRVEDLPQGPVRSLVFELCLLRDFEIDELARSTTLSAIEAMMNTVINKRLIKHRLDSMVPGGVLAAKLCKVVDPALATLLTELGALQSPPLSLRVHGNKTVIRFIEIAMRPPPQRKRTDFPLILGRRLWR
jgi:hypothetical protein